MSSFTACVDRPEQILALVENNDLGAVNIKKPQLVGDLLGKVMCVVKDDELEFVNNFLLRDSADFK